MKPCISQATTLNNPFEADLAVYQSGGWTAVELWLTKLETFLRESSRRRGSRAFGSRRGSTRPPRRLKEVCYSLKAWSALFTGIISGAGWRSCKNWECPR